MPLYSSRFKTNKIFSSDNFLYVPILNENNNLTNIYIYQIEEFSINSLMTKVYDTDINIETFHIIATENYNTYLYHK